MGEECPIERSTRFRAVFANDIIAGLPGLTTNARLLTSLKNELPLLAEAAPDPLLEALEQLLEGNGKAIRPIFNEIGGLVFPRSEHTGVLWALETVAWHPDYFRRASLILAGLAKIDPGGTISNRPINSLVEIFVPWKPSTNASPEARLSVLDEIINRYPDIGWQLICRLLPEETRISSGTARPTLREAATAPPAVITYAAFWAAQREIIRRAIVLATDHPARARELIRPLMGFPKNERVHALAFIEHELCRKVGDGVE